MNIFVVETTIAFVMTTRRIKIVFSMHVKFGIIQFLGRGFAEIFVEVLMKFFRGGTHPGYGPIT